MLISETSQTCHTQSVTSSLGCAVQQAKLALATVQDATPQPPRPKSGVPYTSGAPLIRSTGLSLKISKEGLVGTSSYPARHDCSAEEVGEAVNEFGIKWLAGESVTDQMRRQKEKFWLSLAEQGFVKPPETLFLNKELDIKGQENSGSGAELQETQQALTKQSQSSSIRESSSDISHPVPSTNSRTQHSSSDKHSQSGASSDNRTKQSLPTKRQFNQSMSIDNNGSTSTVSGSESQSFPSYEGISSPE